MAVDFDLERMLAQRPLALERTALPQLAELARMRVGGDADGLRRQFAAVEHSVTTTKVRHSGSIAIVPIVGLITDDPFMAWLTDGTHPDAVARGVREAADDPSTSGILLLVNSPGGGVALIQETAEEIRRARTVKPVVAIARTCCCSAALYLAGQADELIATPSADVGSVGVFVIHIDASKLNDRVGIAPTYVYAGKYKVETNSSAPLAEDARAFLQRGVDATYAQFIKDLAIGRRTSETTIRSKYGDGRYFGAVEAKQRGMVDRIDTLDNVLGRLARSAPATIATRRASLAAATRAADIDLLDTDLSLLERRP